MLLALVFSACSNGEDAPPPYPTGSEPVADGGAADSRVPVGRPDAQVVVGAAPKAR
jgi:hypothetical protein